MDELEFLSKDFIETKEGLVFAVLDQGLEQGRVLCFLRYVKTDSGYRKLATGPANSLLAKEHPDYLFHSLCKDADLHAVAVSCITHHYRPVIRLQQLLNTETEDAVINDLQQLIAALNLESDQLPFIGVTGSLLIGAQNTNSDIDLVFYDRDLFFTVRNRIKTLMKESAIQTLTPFHWQEAYQRRACSLGFDDYLRHEQRKYNKGLINKRKFDIALLDAELKPEPQKFIKIGPMVLYTDISDDKYSYDYPARFSLTDDRVKSCICYTATYTGQARTGEHVVISGLLEQSEAGEQRLVVGSSREANGEFIKVVDLS